MSDKTQIRPGGRKPRGTQQNDEQTIVRRAPQSQSAPPDEQTIVRQNQTLSPGQGTRGNQAQVDNGIPVQPTAPHRYQDPTFKAGNRHEQVSQGPSNAQRYVPPPHNASQQVPRNEQPGQQPNSQSHEQNCQKVPQQNFGQPNNLHQSHQQPNHQQSGYQQQSHHSQNHQQENIQQASNYQPPLNYGSTHQSQVTGDTFSGSTIESRNGLLELVTPLLSVAGKVRTAGGELDLEDLKRHAIQQFQLFQSYQFNLLGHNDLQHKASYGLCCLVDDLVLNTPWGMNSPWRDDSLLSIYHRETWGGEKFFQYLDEMHRDPANSIDVLELYYLAMELGFEGKFRGATNGPAEHKQISQNTYHLIARYKPTVIDALSPQWRGIKDDRNSLVRLVPQWVIWSVATAIGLIVYLIFSILLAQRGDPVNNRVVSQYLDPPLKVIPINKASLDQSLSNSVQPDLEDTKVDYVARFSAPLATELQQEIFTIIETDYGAILRLSKVDLFPSGKASVSAEYEAIIREMAEVINEFDTRVHVVGHTDNVPITNVNFQSNFELSAARAETVQYILAQVVENPTRISAEGVADTRPVVPNNNEANRALNRRVEIELHE